jgi:uncharacterized protein YrrD
MNKNMKLFYQLLGYTVIEIKNMWDADNIMDNVFNKNPNTVFNVHVKKHFLVYKKTK